MGNNEKKVMRYIIAGFLFFCFGFAGGYLFNARGIPSDPAGAGADVANYDAAQERVSRAADEIRGAACNVRDASAEVRIGINDAGDIRDASLGVTDGIDRALYGAGQLEDGIQRVMGILDAAEKRNAEVEKDSYSRLD
jgi:hypothetical protein